MTREGWNGYKWIRISTRWAIYWRDRDLATGEFRCVWCGLEFNSQRRMSLDHLIPVIAGGSNSPANLITSCVPCNSVRGDTDFEAWLDSGNFDPALYDRVVTCLATPLDRAKGRELAKSRPTRTYKTMPRSMKRALKCR